MTKLHKLNSLVLLIGALNVPAFGASGTVFRWGVYPVGPTEMANFPTPANSLNMSWSQLEKAGVLNAAQAERLKEFRKAKYADWKAKGVVKRKNGAICWPIAGLGQAQASDSRDYARLITVKARVEHGREPVIVTVAQEVTTECLESDGYNYVQQGLCSLHENGSPKSGTECMDDPAPDIEQMDRRTFAARFSPVRIKRATVIETYHGEDKGDPNR
jgi:hypothetical protein